MPALTRLSGFAAIVVLALLPAFGVAASTQGTPTPQGYGRSDQGYAAQFGEVIIQLDEFWRAVYRESGIGYQTPTVVAVEGPIQTGCGPAGPEQFAFYCPTDRTIYYAPAGFADHERRIGDFGPIVVISHEWGHHVQRLAGLVPAPGNAFELQADCLAGAYANEAGRLGLLDPGDITEAVASSASAGDPLGLPQDATGAHGINDDRVVAFMRGYFDGPGGCNVPGLASAPAAAGPTDAGDAPAPGAPESGRQSTMLSLWSLAPRAAELADGGQFRTASEGTSSFAEVAGALPHLDAADQRLREWGWQENVFRIYEAAAPGSGVADSIAIGIHRFASADGAAAALPEFAAARRIALGYAPVDLGLIADQTEAMAGTSAIGTEVVIYARRGNLVFRGTGTAAAGDPTAEVIATLLIPLTGLADEPLMASPELFGIIPRVDDLLPGLVLAEEHARSAATIAATFPDVPDAERRFRNWGWRESAARVYTGQTVNGTTRVEISVFRMANELAAAESLPYFLEGRARVLGLVESEPPPTSADDARMLLGRWGGGSEEATVYVRRGRDLFRITALGQAQSVFDLAALIR